MRKKDGAPPFLHHPPACLALFAEDRIDSVGRDKVVEAEARDIQRRLIEQLTQVWAENATFQRLMYKNRNQHRRAVYYRRLSQVRRDLQLLQSLGLVDVVESLVHWAVPGKQNAAPSKAASSYTVLQGIEAKALHMSTVQRRLLGSARLLQQMAEPILDASCQIAGLLSQSFFMPFALTMLALLARFRVLLLQVFYEVVAAFNLVAATSQHTQLAAPISAHSQNIASDGVPVMLECHWDGVKLVLYEKLPPPPPSPTKPLPLPIFVSNTTPLSAAGWFIDDRSTISKEKLLDTETAVLYEREEGLLLEASLDTLQCSGEDAIDKLNGLAEPPIIPKVTSQVEQPLTELNLEGETIPIRLKPVGDYKASEKGSPERVLSGGEHLITSSSKKRVAYISVQLGPSQIQSPSPVGCIRNDSLAINSASIREERLSKLQGKFPAHRSRGLLSDEGSSQREVAVEPHTAEEGTSRAQSQLQVENRKVPLEPSLISPKNGDLKLDVRERAGGAMVQESDASLSSRNLDGRSTSEADIHMSEDGSSLQMKNSEPGVEITKNMVGLLCAQESERKCTINSVTYVSTGYNLVEHDNPSEVVDAQAGIHREQLSGSGPKKEEGKERKKSILDPEDQVPKRMKMDDIFDMLLGN